jgi:hypothetical protein
VSTRALLPAISFGKPYRMIGVRGLTQDQMKIVLFLLFEGGYPFNISSANRYRPKIRLLPPNFSSGLITLVTDHDVSVKNVRRKRVGHDCRTHSIGRKSPIIE